MTEYRHDSLDTITPEQPATPLPPATVRRAALVVCDRCPDDAALMLDMLGVRAGDHLASLRVVPPLLNPKRTGLRGGRR